MKKKNIYLALILTLMVVSTAFCQVGAYYGSGQRSDIVMVGYSIKNEKRVAFTQYFGTEVSKKDSPIEYESAFIELGIITKVIEGNDIVMGIELLPFATLEKYGDKILPSEMTEKIQPDRSIYGYGFSTNIAVSGRIRNSLWWNSKISIREYLETNLEKQRVFIFAGLSYSF